MEQGRSLKELADEAGLTPSQLSRLERGERGVSPAAQDRVAARYGVRPEFLAVLSDQLPAKVKTFFINHPEELDRILDAAETEALQDGSHSTRVVEAGTDGA